MKKLLLGIVMAVFSFVHTAYSQGKLDISLKGVSNPTVYIIASPMDATGKQWADSVELKDGQALFNVKESGKYLVTLMPKPANPARFTLADMRNVQFYYFPGDRLKIDADFSGGYYVPCKITGTDIYDLQAEFFPTAYEKYEKELQERLMRLQEMRMVGAPAAEIAAESDRHIRVLSKINEIKAEYIREHPDSPLSGMYYIHMSPLQSGPLYDKLGDNVKNGRFKDEIAARYSLYKKSAQ